MADTELLTAKWLEDLREKVKQSPEALSTFLEAAPALLCFLLAFESPIRSAGLQTYFLEAQQENKKAFQYLLRMILLTDPELLSNDRPTTVFLEFVQRYIPASLLPPREIQVQLVMAATLDMEREAFHLQDSVSIERRYLTDRLFSDALDYVTTLKPGDLLSRVAEKAASLGS